MDYGRTIRARRRALDLSQGELAQAVGHTQGWLTRVEHAHLSPSEGDRQKLEAFLLAREQPLSIPRAAPKRNSRRAPR